jgi:hypothetical protein
MMRSAKLIQSMPYHLRLGPPNGPFTSGFPTNHTCHMPYPAHPILLDFIVVKTSDRLDEKRMA